MAVSLELSSEKLPEPGQAFLDVAFINPEAFQAIMGGEEQAKASADRGTLCRVGSHVFRVLPDTRVSAFGIALGNFHRNIANISLDMKLPVRRFTAPKKDFIAGSMEFELTHLGGGDASRLTFDAGEVAQRIKDTVSGHVFVVGQRLAVMVESKEGAKAPLSCKVLSFEFMSLEDMGGKEEKEEGRASGGGGGRFAQLLSSTDIVVRKGDKESFRVSGGSASRRPQLFGKGFDFGSLGIGGLDNEFKLIFRQAFASRLLPPAVVDSMGLSHVRGMLLFGPPGCGKTLIARQIGKALRAHDPKVVSGPEVLNKFVGQSEENIRALFADAEKEQAERGDESDLHIIIFDEIDAICRKRGTVGGGTGVHDSIVNQLLSKIDGVDSLNNVLIIGMTNRKDMLDEALLRPGRLEVHVEIGLPDEAGREQILNIHTAKLKAKGYLGTDFDPADLAGRTKNFTGAELARVVRNARSFAIARSIDPSDLTKAIDMKSMILTHADFVRAVAETEPKFGASDEDLAGFYKEGVVPHSSEFRAVENTLVRLVRQCAHSDRSPILSACLSGPAGAGKSALAAKIAAESGFPFIKRVGPEDMLAMAESGKARFLAETFDDAYRSPLSLVVLDDIERMMDYVPIGPRFANGVLQTLLVLLRRAPPTEGRRLLVIATTAEDSLLDDMGLLAAFTAVQRLPLLTEAPQYKAVLDASAADCMAAEQRELAAQRLADRPTGMPIKRLLALVDMARHAEDTDDPTGADRDSKPSVSTSVVTAEALVLCALESGVH